MRLTLVTICVTLCSGCAGQLWYDASRSVLETTPYNELETEEAPTEPSNHIFAEWNSMRIPNGWQLADFHARSFRLESDAGTAYVRFAGDGQRLLWSVTYTANDQLCMLSNSEPFTAEEVPTEPFVEPDSYSIEGCANCAPVPLIATNWPVQPRFFVEMFHRINNPIGGRCVPYPSGD